ncbi:MAG: VOC family protein [Candidatus Dormibacteraeota bacterium]|nr:VOC family protein [Candidatus Dormibacteraeota bacterium]
MSTAIQISPYVNFQGKAREALEFYSKVFGGKVDHRQGQSTLETDGIVIIGADGHPDYPAKVGENMGISVTGTDKERLTKIFSGLAEGGKISMPLKAQAWGGEVGWLSDKYGIRWTVNVNKP